MITATEIQRQAFGGSSGSENEAHPQRRALAEVSGESSDSDGEALSSDSENEALGESSEMENQSLEESSDSENEALEESSDNGDVIEARAEAQRRAILEAFGESSDSEDEALLALKESSEDEAGTLSSSLVCGLALARKSALEVSRDSEDEADSSFRCAKAQRLALVQAFGETSDTEEEICSSHQIMELEEEATSRRWEMVEGIKGLWLCRDFLSAKHQSLLMQAIHREGWFEGSDNNQGMRFGNLPEWATELSRSIWDAVCFAEVVGEETTEDSCMEGACPLPVDILSRVPLFDQLIINVYQPGNMCSCGPDAF